MSELGQPGQPGEPGKPGTNGGGAGGSGGRGGAGGSSHFQRVFIDRVIPLLMIVVFPLLATIYLVNRQQIEDNKKADLAGCLRGNELRERQKTVLLSIAASNQILSDRFGGDETKDGRDLHTISHNARVLAGKIAIVDCEHDPLAEGADTP